MGFTEYPAQWEWVALILGGVALLMAVQPFIQFIWGRAKVSVDLSAKDRGDSRVLICWVFNHPIRNKFLKFLKVKRDSIEALSAICNIVDKRTQTEIKEDFILELATAKDIKGVEVALPSSPTPASIDLVQANASGNIYLKDGTTLKPSAYELNLTIHFDGNRFDKRASFFTGNKPHELYWEETKS